MKIAMVTKMTILAYELFCVHWCSLHIYIGCNLRSINMSEDSDPVKRTYQTVPKAFRFLQFVLLRKCIDTKGKRQVLGEPQSQATTNP